MSRRSIHGLVLCACLGACLPGQQLEKPRTGRVGDNNPTAAQPLRGGTAASTKEIPVGSKKVSGKEAPSTLIAVDGTRCQVTANKYDETSIGESVLCNWR